MHSYVRHDSFTCVICPGKFTSLYNYVNIKNICTYIYTCIYFVLCTYIYRSACVCIYVDMYEYIHIYVNMRKYIYSYIYICVHMYTFIHMFYVCIYTGLPGNMSKKADVGKTTLRKLDKYTLSKVSIAFILHSQISSQQPDC